MKGQMKERKESRMTPSFLGLDDGVVVLPSTGNLKAERGDDLEQGETFGFGCRESEGEDGTSK